MHTKAMTSFTNDITVEAQTPFSSFLQYFETRLKEIFHETGDIDRMCSERGWPAEVWSEIMSTNPLSVAIPVAYGGRGGKVKEILSVMSAASYESLPLSLTIGINNALFLQPVAKYAQEDVKRPIFERFLKHQNMGGLMITEPDYGTDALSMQTSYTEQGANFHLKGTKHWAGLTGMADYWLLTARKQSTDGALQRDIDFFICDVSYPGQEIVVEEYFENLGLYPIPYGRNRIDVRIPAMQRLVPHTTGVQMMLDLLHRSRLHFPGMGMGFVHRMLDEAMEHTRTRFVGGRSLFGYDQVQQRLARLQASYTICSAFCARSSDIAGIEHNLVPHGFEANVIKSVTSDLMQEAAQSLVQLVGAKAYKQTHVAGRAITDSRPFQIFEGSNDVLYNQISDTLLKLMRTAKEKSLFQFLKSYSHTSLATEYFKEQLHFDVDLQLPQRKMVELGQVISRLVSMNLVILLGERGFRMDLISSTLQSLQKEITESLSAYQMKLCPIVVEGYQENSSWMNMVGR